MRVLPSINEDINMEWISDKTRFFYDSFDYLRIQKPWFKKFQSFMKWRDTINILSSQIKKKNSQRQYGRYFG